MPTNNPEALMQQLRSFIPKYCDNCGHKHSPSDFSYVGQRDGIFAFQISCKRCGALQLIRLQPGMPGISLQKIMNNTDVRGAEFSKFAGKPQVDKEEALDVYLDMQEVNTLDDFLNLLDQEATEEELNDLLGGRSN